MPRRFEVTIRPGGHVVADLWQWHRWWVDEVGGGHGRKYVSDGYCFTRRGARRAAKRAIKQKTHPRVKPEKYVVEVDR